MQLNKYWLCWELTACTYERDEATEDVFNYSLNIIIVSMLQGWAVTSRRAAATSASVSGDRVIHDQWTAQSAKVTLALYYLSSCIRFDDVVVFLWQTRRHSVHRVPPSQPKFSRTASQLGFWRHFCLLTSTDYWTVYLYVEWQGCKFFLSYLCQLFSRHDVGQAVWTVCYCDITFLVR